jgi:hypothetical protein
MRFPSTYPPITIFSLKFSPGAIRSTQKKKKNQKNQKSKIKSNSTRRPSTQLHSHRQCRDPKTKPRTRSHELLRINECPKGDPKALDSLQAPRLQKGRRATTDTCMQKKASNGIGDGRWAPYLVVDPGVAGGGEGEGEVAILGDGVALHGGGQQPHWQPVLLQLVRHGVGRRERQHGGQQQEGAQRHGDWGRLGACEGGIPAWPRRRLCAGVGLGWNLVLGGGHPQLATATTSAPALQGLAHVPFDVAEPNSVAARHPKADQTF